MCVCVWFCLCWYCGYLDDKLQLVFQYGYYVSQSWVAFQSLTSLSSVCIGMLCVVSPLNVLCVISCCYHLITSLSWYWLCCSLKNNPAGCIFWFDRFIDCCFYPLVEFIVSVVLVLVAWLLGLFGLMNVCAFLSTSVGSVWWVYFASQ